MQPQLSVPLLKVKWCAPYDIPNIRLSWIYAFIFEKFIFLDAQKGHTTLQADLFARFY